ncbi:MAG: hypothetical protein KBE22_12270 [Candidatus Accumulibacter sp.]|nr:hypothetical protein [Accumulibacter sp.]
MKPSQAVDASMRRPALTDRQIARMAWRIQRFQRFGLPTHYAEKLADMLADRDWQRDDRRICLECSEYARDGSCLPARQGRMSYASRKWEPVRDVLQRCEHFSWAMPA